MENPKITKSHIWEQVVVRRAWIIWSYAGARAAMGCYEFRRRNYIAVASIYLVLHAAMPLWSLWPSIDFAGLATSLLWPKTGFADVGPGFLREGRSEWFHENKKHPLYNNIWVQGGEDYFFYHSWHGAGYICRGAQQVANPAESKQRSCTCSLFRNWIRACLGMCTSTSMTFHLHIYYFSWCARLLGEVVRCVFRL